MHFLDAHFIVACFFNNGSIGQEQEIVSWGLNERKYQLVLFCCIAQQSANHQQRSNSKSVQKIIDLCDSYKNMINPIVIIFNLIYFNSFFTSFISFSLLYYLLIFVIFYFCMFLKGRKYGTLIWQSSGLDAYL